MYKAILFKYQIWLAVQFELLLTELNTSKYKSTYLYINVYIYTYDKY